MKILCVFLLVFSIISCCESPTQINETTKKYYSGEHSIDLNSDGKDDISWEIRYIGNETTTDALFTVRSRNSAELLHNHQFFERGDTITFDAIDPWFWHSFPSDLASLRTNTGIWRGNWVGQTGYLPIKISANNSMHTGWVNLTMDTVNQKIIFNYSDFNIQPNSDFIIID
jgi:hypothetical protein